MSDIEKNVNDEELMESPVLTLTDEETGEERDFELIAEATIGEKRYYALIPADDDEGEEYVILRVTEDGDDLLLESIDDDDEFDRVADAFEDTFMGEIDLDGSVEE